MKSTSKKVFALLLAGIMSASLTACGGSGDAESSTAAEGSGSSASTAEDGGDLSYNTTGYPIVDEEITVTVSGPTPSGLEDWTQVVVIDEFAKRLGIRLDCNFYATDWATQLTLMIAGDDLPDFIGEAYMNPGDANTWGSEGYFLNLNDYRDLTPNMNAAFEEYPEAEAFCTAPDGAIYALPRMFTDMTDRTVRTFINRVWLENLGLSLPTSIDELYETLVAFKEQDANGNGDPNDEIPMLYQSGYNASERTLMDAFGIHTTEVTYILQADDQGQVYLAETSDAYKEYIKFMHRLYAEGLMEQEAFTITGEEITNKQQGDVYGFFGCGSAPFVMANKDISYDNNWLALAGLTSDLDDSQSVTVGSPVQNTLCFAINANTEYPEALVRFFDYFYSEEGIRANSNGYDGVTFDYVHNDLLGVDVPTMRCPEGYASGEEYRYKTATLNGTVGFWESNPDRVALFEVDESVLQNEEIRTTFGWAALVAEAFNREGNQPVAGFPRLSYTAEETEQRSSLYADISTYLEQVKAQFITGEVDIDEYWDTFIETLNQMGLEDILAIEQAAYERYLEVVGE